MIVKNRLDLTFIIGNENVTNLNCLDLKKILVGSRQIKVEPNTTQLSSKFLKINELPLKRFETPSESTTTLFY